MVTARNRCAFVLFLFALSPYIARAQTNDQAKQELSNILDSLVNPIDRLQARGALNRLEEGCKVQPDRKSPRIIDGSKWFVRRQRASGKAFTTPDNKDSGESTPGWGPDEEILVNEDIFVFIRNKYVNPVQPDVAAGDMYMAKLKAMVLLKEGLNVDASAVTQADVIVANCHMWTTVTNIYCVVLDECYPVSSFQLAGLRRRFSIRKDAAMRTRDRFCQ